MAMKKKTKYGTEPNEISKNDNTRNIIWNIKFNSIRIINWKTDLLVYA